MTGYSKSLLDKLSLKIKDYPRFSLTEIEKFCWMAAHEYKHGVLPWIRYKRNRWGSLFTIIAEI